MAHITMGDGSKLELTEAEFQIYLRTMAPAPKSQAERAIEAMAEYRQQENGTTIVEAKTDIEEVPDAPEATEMEEAQAKADVTGKPVEVNGARIFPGGQIIPRWIANPGGTKGHGKIKLPLTEGEFAIMIALRRAGHPIKIERLAAIMGRSQSALSSAVSKIHNQSRGIVHGPHSTWTVAPWALHAEWVLRGRPMSHWPPKQSGE